MSLLLGLVKLSSSADMLMNTAPQCTALIVILHEAVEPNCHPYLPNDSGDIFFHCFNICGPGSDLIL